jgi:ribonuclease HII
MNQSPVCINDDLERILIETAFDNVIGVDEVGRGSWAGPVVAAAFVYTKNSYLVPNVNDSKKLTLLQRKKISRELRKGKYCIAQAEVEKIDSINILEATKFAINQAVNDLRLEGKTIVLVDGYYKEAFDFEYRCIVKGDAKHYSIAAASILAKVYRDNLMKKLASQYPYYGFETNVGYGTKKHQDALAKYGVCDIHRKSYKPIRELLLRH